MSCLRTFPASARTLATAAMLAGGMKTLVPLLALVLAQAAATPSPPAAREIAPDTFLLPGAVPADRGPDGNTVMLVAPSGLAAIDTGRHL